MSRATLMPGFTNLRLKWPNGAFKTHLLKTHLYHFCVSPSTVSLKNNMRLLTYIIHATILLIIIFIHGRFVIALEIATSLANNAPVDTVEYISINSNRNS